MPPMPANIKLHFARDDDSNDSSGNGNKANNSKPQDVPKPPNAALIAGLTTTTVIILFLILVVAVPMIKRRRVEKKEKPKAPPPTISQFLDKNSRFDRSFHGHRRAPSGLEIVDLNQAYIPGNRRPPHQQLPYQGERGRDIPAVHFNDQPEHLGPRPDEISQVQQDRPISYQYYIPPPNDYVDNPFPPTPGTARTPNTSRTRDGDPFADQPPSSQVHPYHDIGLSSASPSPKVPEAHWDQYQPQSARTPHRPDTSNGLTPKSAPGQRGDTDGEASPLTAYINHLNTMADPPATAPAYSSFTAPRSAGLPFQHQQAPRHGRAPPQLNLLPSYAEEDHDLSSGSDYSATPASRGSSAARLGPGYGPGTRGTGYDHNIPHSMPTHGHVSFAQEQAIARTAAAKRGAGTALRDRFGGGSPRPSPGMGGFASAGLGGFASAGLPSPAHLSANPNKSHFSPMTPDFRQSRMPLTTLDALPEVPNSSIAYGFALPPSPLSPGDEIVVSPSPYHSSFAMNR